MTWVRRERVETVVTLPLYIVSGVIVLRACRRCSIRVSSGCCQGVKNVWKIPSREKEGLRINETNLSIVLQNH